MATSMADARFELAKRYGFPGDREDWDRMRAYGEARVAKAERRERRLQRAQRFQQAKRSRRAPTAAIGRERPAWQRRGHLPRRVVAVLENPRVRGQIS